MMYVIKQTHLWECILYDFIFDNFAAIFDHIVIEISCLNANLQAIRLSLEQTLPPEPKEETGEPISKLRIRTPSGEFLERRFLGSCKLQVLFDFVASKGYPSDEFKLLTTFPRRNVSLHTRTQTHHRSPAISPPSPLTDFLFLMLILKGDF